MPRMSLNSKVEGRGPHVVLLHPVGLDLASWDAVADRLARHYTVLRPDLAGHGLSALPRDGASLADYADDVHELLVAQAFGPAVVVGLSFGGMVAQVLAVRHPADVSGLVVCGCGATFPAPIRDILRARGDSAAQGGMEAVLDETLQRWFTPGFIAGGGAEATRLRLLADRAAGWAAAWHAISGLDVFADLPGVAVPTLCIAGELDLAAPPAMLAAVAAQIPGARAQVLPLAPHMMQIETADRFAEAVEAFLREADTPLPTA